MSIFQNFYRKVIKKSVWARPEMDVTFRAELMPGKNRAERTFRIAEGELQTVGVGSPRLAALRLGREKLQLSHKR